MDAPTIVASNAADTIPSGIAAGDLLLTMLYVQPVNASGSPSYGTVTPPEGWTMLPITPVASNDAVWNRTQHSYVAYKWSDGTENGIAEFAYGPGDYIQENGVLAIRGATDADGEHVGTPYLASATASSPSTGAAFPAVSLTAPADSLLIYIGTSWQNVTSTGLAGWEPVGKNSSSATTLYKTGAPAGPTGDVAPADPAANDPATSILLAFGGVAQAVPSEPGPTPNPFQAMQTLLKSVDALATPTNNRIWLFEVPDHQVNRFPQNAITISPAGGSGEFEGSLIELGDVRMDIRFFGRNFDGALDLFLDTRDFLHRLTRTTVDDTVIHWARKAGGPIQRRLEPAKEPTGVPVDQSLFWPVIDASWQVRAATIAPQEVAP